MVNNSKNFIKSAKFRVAAIAVAVIAIFAIVVSIWHHHLTSSAFKSSSAVSSNPAIQSLPGAGNPSNAYVSTQNIQNALQAKQARHDATSFVPTITRSSFIGSSDQFSPNTPIVPQDTPTSQQCPIKKVVYMFRPNPASCTVDNLRLARNSGVTAEELLCQACSCPMLRLAGYTAGELKGVGYSATDLKKCGFPIAALKAAGFSAESLKNAGFTAAELEQAGFTAGQLKAAGFSAKDLKDAGFSAQTLKDAGYSAAQLKDAGFSAAELQKAGFTPQALKDAGFTAAQLKAAGIESSNLTDVTCNASALKKARASGLSATELKEKGCGLAALKAAGYTASELRNAGFTAGQLEAAGFSAKDLKDAGFSAKALKDAGYSAAQLKDAGFSAGDLKGAGFTAAQLKAAGYTAKQLHAAGYSAADLKNAGFSADQLRNAGYTKGDLLRAGFTAQQAGYHLNPPPQQQPSQSPAVSSDANTLGSQQNLNNNPQGAGASIPAINSNSAAERLREIQQLQQQQMNAQQRRDMAQQMQGQMSLQAQKLMAEWSNDSSQSYNVALQQPAENGANEAESTGSTSAEKETGPVIKAGSILFAVLDTGINSDDKSPILATIVNGKFKGTKVVGNFERVNKKVLVRFTMMNVPSFDHTFGINAVAIDSNTAHTALSGYVNNHYLLRYGTLFASAFISGLSQGIVQSGATQDCFLGFCHTTYQKLTPGQYAAIGLGNVGQQYSNVMGQNFNIPPTIKIAGGTGIGLLFMSDVTLPDSLPSKNNLNS